jgi:hypothetical protein
MCPPSHRAVIWITAGSAEKPDSEAMYCVFVQLGDGEFLYVASRDDFRGAVELVEGFKAHWPHNYVVLNSEGDDIQLEESRATSPELGSVAGIPAKAHAKSSVRCVASSPGQF